MFLCINLAVVWFHKRHTDSPGLTCWPGEWIRYITSVPSSRGRDPLSWRLTEKTYKHKQQRRRVQFNKCNTAIWCSNKLVPLNNNWCTVLLLMLPPSHWWLCWYHWWGTSVQFWTQSAGSCWGFYSLELRLLAPAAGCLEAGRSLNSALWTDAHLFVWGTIGRQRWS